MIEFDVILRAVGALLAGGLIGLERSYHGRAAGLRTYALVCFAAALPVAAVAYPQMGAQSALSAEVSRVIQGILTGIGFLGAGVILKDGFTVRGLTTAASIWTTAGIGVLIGMGYNLSAAAATLFTLITLSLLKGVEGILPSQSYVHCHISFPRAQAMDEEGIRALVEQHGFHIAEMSYGLFEKTGSFQYRMLLWSAAPLAPARLAKALKALPSVAEFRLSPTRD